LSYKQIERVQLEKQLDLLLVQPPLNEYTGAKKIYLDNGSFTSEPPLGLCYIGAMVRDEGFNVKILDMDILRLNEQDFLKIICSLKPKVIGISSLILTYPKASQLATIAKSYNPEIKIIFGGIHPTMVPEIVIQNRYVDIVVVGEGEYPMVEIMKNITLNIPDFSKIKGILWKKDKQIQINQKRGFESNIDNFPFPARELLIGDANQKYFSFLALKNPISSVLTTRGCPFGCNFCTKIFHKPRFRSSQNVIQELELISEQLKIKEFVFRDSTFNINKDHLISITRALIKNQIDLAWRAVCRPELIDQVQLQYMKKSNCYVVTFGAESGSDNILKFLNKGYNTNQIKNAFDLAKRIDIESHAVFMLGIPGETTADINKTLQFIKHLSPNYVQITIYTPIPGTDLYNYLLKKKLLPDCVDYSNLLNFSHPSLNLPNLPDKYLIKIRKIGLFSHYTNIHTIKNIGLSIAKNPNRFFNNFQYLLKSMKLGEI
jgi:radical SAM superfamily enzyme YgiQ (UPF0313 family)